LHGRGDAPKDLCRVDKGLRCLEFGFCVDDLGPPVALGFGLFSNRAYSYSRKILTLAEIKTRVTTTTIGIT